MEVFFEEEIKALSASVEDDGDDEAKRRKLGRRDSFAWLFRLATELRPHVARGAAATDFPVSEITVLEYIYLH